LDKFTGATARMVDQVMNWIIVSICDIHLRSFNKSRPFSLVNPPVKTEPSKGIDFYIAISQSPIREFE
jgi:hypothetical protein